jgi:hypothetical protein
MSLRKRPTLTPALLAANRANAQKSTGPRTVRGKNRIVLNGLKQWPLCLQLLPEPASRQDQGGRRVVPMDSRPSARRLQASRLANGPTGRAVGAAGVVRVRPTGTADARNGSALGERPGEVPPAVRIFVGAALDPAAAGRARSEPGICREISR